MDFVIGGLAAGGAGILTNPLEVLKHHIDLNKKCSVNPRYKNIVQAGFLISKENGMKSLQKGLGPAFSAHVISYGLKLGTYQHAYNQGYLTNSNGGTIIPLSIASSTLGGIMGQYLSTPFYLLKSQVGQQTQGKKLEDNAFLQPAIKIFKEHGIKGFFKGATALLPRAFIGTSQLTSFAIAKESFNKYDALREFPLMITILASAIAGVVLSMAMTPFDMVLTKLYKQAIGPNKGGSQPYNGFLDCIKKTYLKNGFSPFYRGIGPIYLKLGPHTILCLVFWEQLKDFYSNSDSTRNEYNPLQFKMYKEEFLTTDNHENYSQLYW